MAADPRAFVFDQPQQLIAELMGKCKWSGTDIHAAWDRLKGELDRLEAEYWDNVDEAKRKAFYAAKRIWPIRDEATPSTEGDAKPVTWAEWFEQMFGEPLERYAERAKRENIRRQVMEYEIRKFGRSPLQRGKNEDPNDGA